MAARRGRRARDAGCAPPERFLDVWYTQLMDDPLAVVRRIYRHFDLALSADVEAPQRILKICDRVKRTTGLTLRRLNKAKLDDELKICHQLFNQTLDRNWGFVPSKLEEWQYGAQDMKAVVDPSLVLFAEKDGVRIGFGEVRGTVLPAG